jgi:(p)ppGpp synthase/HD superfamily hydrolase
MKGTSAMLPLLQFARALDFAARKHADQRRKGPQAEPYLNHLAEVARLVADATDGADTVAVLAALLHDTLEDTDTTHADLEAHFGLEVASVVAEVTDDKSLPKAERKRRQVENAPGRSHRGRLVKLADKTSNLRSLAISPPVGWAYERRLEYFTWAKSVVDGIRGTSPFLESLFDQAWRQGMRDLIPPSGPQPHNPLAPRGPD